MISSNRIARIKEQGYNLADAKISALAFGNRMAYAICTIILLVGVATANIPLLALMMGVALLGVLLPYHPFDYLYNHAVRHWFGKPELPQRSKQLKFACTTATLLIGATIFLFSSGYFLAAYITGFSLSSVASLVSLTDICIPSKVYNYAMRIR